MAYYEVMFIVRPDLEADEEKAVLENLKAVITKEDGSVSTILDWRKRRLSYEIQKYTEGQYYLAYFSGEGEVIPEVEHYFRVSDAVIRYMVIAVSAEDYNAAVEKAAQDAQQAAARAAASAAEEAAAKEGAAEDVKEEVKEDAKESAAESVKETAEEAAKEEEAVPEAEAKAEEEQSATEAEEEKE